MGIFGDIQFALRTFSRARLFVLVAVLSLAFGIGANTAIFSLTDQLLVRSLPVVQPEQLAMLSAVGRHYGSNQGMNRISYPMYADFRNHNAVFSGMFCFRETSMSLAYGGRTERVAGEMVSGNYFPVLGVKPALGRLFTATDDLRQGGHPVAVLSFGYWRNRFGGDPKILGRKLLINGYPFTVVGVVQQGFSGTDPGTAPQVRVPVTMAKQIGKYLDLNERRSRWVTAFGRLKPGVTVQQARASLQPYFHSNSCDGSAAEGIRQGVALHETAVSAHVDGCVAGRQGPLRYATPIFEAATGVDGDCWPGAVDCVRECCQPDDRPRHGPTERDCGAPCHWLQPGPHCPATADRERFAGRGGRNFRITARDRH